MSGAAGLCYQMLFLESRFLLKLAQNYMTEVPCFCCSIFPSLEMDWPCTRSSVPARLGGPPQGLDGFGKVMKVGVACLPAQAEFLGSRVDMLYVAHLISLPLLILCTLYND